MINESERLVHDQLSSQRRPWRRLFGRFNGMLLLMTWTGLSLAIVGCGSSDDHHEDEHLEHFVPAHKPADYSTLVEQLDKRIAQQLQLSDSGAGAVESSPTATARQELIDIIGWIPELAADSELRKAEFEAAVSAGTRLSHALGFENPAESTAPVDQSMIPTILEELKALVPKSQTSTEPMSSWRK